MSNNPEHPHRASSLFQNLGLAVFGAGAAASIIATAQHKLSEGSVKEMHNLLGNPKTIAGASIAACVVLGALRMASAHLEEKAVPTTTLNNSPESESFGTVQQSNRNQSR